VDDGLGDEFSRVAPISELGKGKNWGIQGREGDMFRIVLDRDPDDLTDISLTWVRLDNRSVEAVRSRYFLVGTSNKWGGEGMSDELKYSESLKAFTFNVKLTAIPTEFQIIENKNWDKCIHPDRRECSQMQAHEVHGPDARGHDLNWQIGKSAADKARVGDFFTVMLALEPLKVSWKKV